MDRCSRACVRVRDEAAQKGRPPDPGLPVTGLRSDPAVTDGMAPGLRAVAAQASPLKGEALPSARSSSLKHPPDLRRFEGETGLKFIRSCMRVSGGRLSKRRPAAPPRTTCTNPEKRPADRFLRFIPRQHPFP